MNMLQLETPCLILDKGKLEKNINTMNRHLQAFDVKLRPHGKTAKNIEAIRMSMANHSAGITVSTLKEAEYYFSNGITDIIYAVGIAPVKLNKVIGLIKKGADLAVILDSLEQVDLVSRKASENDVEIPACIEIDADNHRSGVQPDDPLLLDIARALNQGEGTSLRGVLTHAGASYQSKTIDQLKEFADVERTAAVTCADILDQNGYPCQVVSIGSTPTVLVAENFTGITEVRAGVYMFMDLVMSGLGVCTVEDIAVSVLTSVIGHQKEKGWIITDAGWMAMSRDRGTGSQAVDYGYGLACDVSGIPQVNLIVATTNQEHGIIHTRDNSDSCMNKFPVGTMLRILPNHACATAAMHDRYHVVDGSVEIVDMWHRVNGW